MLSSTSSTSSQPLSESSSGTTSRISTSSCTNSNILSYFSFANIQGLKPKTVPSKVPYVKDLIGTNNQLFIGLSETWIKDHLEAELAIPNYTLYKADRHRFKKSNRGRDTRGVCAYIRNDLAGSMEEILSYSNGVVEVVALFFKILNLYLCTVQAT